MSAQDWLVACDHCGHGNVFSLHPDGSVGANGKPLISSKPRAALTMESGCAATIYPNRIVFDDYFKSYGEVVHELTEANKRLVAMRESLHQSLHPQTTDGMCRYCDKEDAVRPGRETP